MTRYHQFNNLYPEEAKKISDANQDLGEIIWEAFTKATWLHSFFPFSFTPTRIKDKAISDDIDSPSEGL